MDQIIETYVENIQEDINMENKVVEDTENVKKEDNQVNDDEFIENVLKKEGFEVMSDDSSEEESDLEGDIDLDALDEDGETGPKSYLKTQNETNPEDVENVGPKFEQVKLDDLDQTEQFGTVVQYVAEGSGIILIMPSDQMKIYDLDNIVCLSDNEENTALSKLVIGFIADVVGPVSMPLYCVAFYKSFGKTLAENGITDIRSFLKDREVLLVKKCLKTINSKLPEIMSRKGCDASNIYDEEATSDQEFSDDEAEREAKKQRKNKRRQNQKRNEELEEGEIQGERPQKKRQAGNGYSENNKKLNNNYHRNNQPQQIPAYGQQMPNPSMGPAAYQQQFYPTSSAPQYPPMQQQQQYQNFQQPMQPMQMNNPQQQQQQMPPQQFAPNQYQERQLLQQLDNMVPPPQQSQQPMSQIALNYQRQMQMQMNSNQNEQQQFNQKQN